MNLSCEFCSLCSPFRAISEVDEESFFFVSFVEGLFDLVGKLGVAIVFLDGGGLNPAHDLWHENDLVEDRADGVEEHDDEVDPPSSSLEELKFISVNHHLDHGDPVEEEGTTE